MSFFTDAEITEFRDLTEEAMDVEITIRLPSTKDFTEATLRTNWIAGAERFSGNAALRPVNPSRVPTVGETQYPYRAAMFHVPHTAPRAQRDDLVTVDACDRNPVLVDEVFRVTGVAFDSDLVSWTLHVEHVAESRKT